MFLFAFGRCRVEVKFSCFALLAFCCLFAGASSSAFLFLAVALHESAHLVVLFLFQAPPRSVQLSALGCRVILNSEHRIPYRKNVLVSLAGPFVNLFSWGILALFSQGTHIFAMASLALGVFHCLPIEPLDGGLALRSLLSGVMDERKAGKVTFFLSISLLFPLSVLGFFILLHTRYNFSLLLMSLYLMLYLVLKRDYLED